MIRTVGGVVKHRSFLFVGRFSTLQAPLLDLGDVPIPLRSVLYLPGGNERALEKSTKLPCDAVIFDLEDVVAPSDTAKNAARELVSHKLQKDLWNKKHKIIRINGHDTRWYARDMESACSLANDGKIDAILLPKVNFPSDLQLAKDSIVKYSSSNVQLWAMVETPVGVMNLREIASFNKGSGDGTSNVRLSCLVAGTSDLTADMRARHTPSRTPMLFALSNIVTAARANGLNALDGVHLNFKNEDEFKDNCVQGRELGFDGKTLIHPTQIAAANEHFSATSEEIAHARAIVHAWEDAKAKDLGVFTVNGRLIEVLHVREAYRILEFVKKCNAIADIMKAE